MLNFDHCHEESRKVNAKTTFLTLRLEYELLLLFLGYILVYCFWLFEEQNQEETIRPFFPPYFTVKSDGEVTLRDTYSRQPASN